MTPIEAEVPIERPQMVIPSTSRSRTGFVTGVAWTFATRLGMMAAGLGSSILIARWLGAEGLGQFAVINLTVALALQFGSAGLPAAMIYFVAKDRSRLAIETSNSFLFAIVAGTIIALLVMAMAFRYPGLFGFIPPRLLAVGAISLPFWFITSLGMNLFLGIDRVRRFNFIEGSQPLLVLFNAVLVLIVIRSGLFMMVSFNTAAAALLSIATIVLVLRSLREELGGVQWRPNLRLFKQTVAHAMKFYVSIIAAMIVIRSDLLIVNHYRGHTEAGVYAVASQVATLLMLLPGVISTLLFPRVASANDPRGDFTARVTRHTSLLMLVVTVAAVPIALALPLVYGRAFSEASIQLLILLPGVYLISTESVLVQHFTGTGMPPILLVFWVVAIVVNVGLNLLLIPRFGARAAALTSTISYALLFVLVAYYFCLKTSSRLLHVLLPHSDELRNLLALLRRDHRLSA